EGIILARAGVGGLGGAGVITEFLDPSWMLRAVGQGALGLECRAADGETLALLRQLDHPPTRLAVLAERALLRALGGGCLVPLGALGTVTENHLSLRAAVVDPHGRRRIDGAVSGPADDAARPGRG